MENKPSTAIVTLGYGVIIALAIIVFSLILFLLNIAQGNALEYLTYLILLGGLFLAQTNYRNKYLGGFIEYRKAFVIGMLTSLFVGIIFGIYTFVFLKYIDPGAMEEALSIAEQKLMDRGMSDMEIEQGMAIARKFQSVGLSSFGSLLAMFIIGTILSLITAIFVKKENTDFGQPAA
jgi:O-antigen/teichoic acid export membrane protein